MLFSARRMALQDSQLSIKPNSDYIQVYIKPNSDYIQIYIKPDSNYIQVYIKPYSALYCNNLYSVIYMKANITLELARYTIN